MAMDPLNRYMAEALARDCAIQGSISVILSCIGEDPNRDGLKETPARVARSYMELFGGYKQDPKDILKVFDGVGYDEMVIAKDIEFYSQCEHHMIPFFGKAHIAYIPNGPIVGVSKLARLLDCYSRRLQVQERLCQQVVTALMAIVQPKGAACVIEARHLCMCARGVGKQQSVMITSALDGVFKKPEVRAEFFSLIK